MASPSFPGGGFTRQPAHGFAPDADAATHWPARMDADRKRFDEALRLANIPSDQKELLPIKSFETQKIANQLMAVRRPENYDPFDHAKMSKTTTRASLLRTRGFRQAVIEAYDFQCAVCGLKIHAPDAATWEVEAAHIVPHRALGRDDIFNGLALCGLHHWAFDTGWFTLQDDYKLRVSPQKHRLPADFGKMDGYDFLLALAGKTERIRLPSRREIYPHINALRWHQQFFSVVNNDRKKHESNK